MVYCVEYSEGALDAVVSANSQEGLDVLDPFDQRCAVCFFDFIERGIFELGCGRFVCCGCADLLVRRPCPFDRTRIAKGCPVSFEHYAKKRAQSS